MPLKVRSPEPLSSGFTRKEYAASVSGKAANGWAVAPAGQAGKGDQISFGLQEKEMPSLVGYTILEFLRREPCQAPQWSGRKEPKPLRFRKIPPKGFSLLQDFAPLRVLLSLQTIAPPFFCKSPFFLPPQDFSGAYPNHHFTTQAAARKAARSAQRAAGMA